MNTLPKQRPSYMIRRKVDRSANRNLSMRSMVSEENKMKHRNNHKLNGLSSKTSLGFRSPQRINLEQSLIQKEVSPRQIFLPLSPIEHQSLVLEGKSHLPKKSLSRSRNQLSKNHPKTIRKLVKFTHEEMGLEFPNIFDVSALWFQGLRSLILHFFWLSIITEISNYSRISIMTCEACTRISARLPDVGCQEN